MLSRTLSTSKKSIHFKLMVGLLSVMLPIITFLIYNNFYAIHVVRNQVAESYKSMMSLYINQIDISLENVDSYLMNLDASSTELQLMQFSREEGEYILAKMALYSKINNDITMYKSINSIFTYSITRQDFMAIGNGEHIDIRDYVVSMCNEFEYSDQAYTSDWHGKKIGDRYYLFRILKRGDVYIGAWAEAKSLLAPLGKVDFGQNGASLLTTGEGEPMVNEQIIRDNNLDLNLDFTNYYLMGDKYKYLVVGEKSTKGNFNLIALIPDSKILEKLPYFQRGITIISFILILMLPVALLLLRKIIITPLKKMLSAMKRIQDGNLEVRIEQYATSKEFQVVNETFNKMMGEIEELKINVYEEKINRQKAELQHLQLQINPHFFLNSLNIIHTLARGKNFELIQEMTLCLIQYFRYVFKSNLTFVTLRDELKHVRNYIRIQELRFPKSLSYNINVPELLLDKAIPPLIIHTFIENSIKYAVSRDEQLHISVDIELVEDRSVVPSFKIVIRDNGSGFKEEVLTEIRAGNRIVDEQGEHIGIWNVQHRLSILYKGYGRLLIGNGETGGAFVELTLPLNIDSLELEG